MNDGSSEHKDETAKPSSVNWTTLVDEAKVLCSRLGGGAQLVYLTEDKKSWYILVKTWKPSPDQDTFAAQWDLHPQDFHSLVLFGKTVYESRWSQSWGVSYAYSGTVSPARAYRNNRDGKMVQSLIDEVNELVFGIYCPPPDAAGDSAGVGGATTTTEQPPYNGCLQNWYLPEHRIGLHSDDESAMKKNLPIFSLSWGGTRRFLFRKRGNRRQVQELLLEDGDLLVMGGTCQQTHKHEVPKHRTTMDPTTSERINWTIRAFEQDGED